MKEIIETENLVIGGNISALEFSFREGYPIFYPELDTPLFLERTKEGISKKNIIDNYAFLLSLAGLNYYSPSLYEFREEKQKLVISFIPNGIIEIRYNILHDYRQKFNKKNYYKVIDYINVRSCGNHNLREIKIKNNIIKEIHFYPSSRNNSSKNFDILKQSYEKITKDALVVSHVKGSDLEKEEYSHIYTRLKLKEIMKETGIKGKKCGFYEDGKQKYNSIKLEFHKREIVNIEKQERDYFYSQSKNTYLNKLYKYLYGRNS